MRETLSYLKNELPGLSLHQAATGTKAFDWEIPQEWRVRDAYLEHESGQKFAEFTKNNLHLVGYSVPTDEVLSLEDLRSRIHTLPNTPDWIPYVTSIMRRIGASVYPKTN